MATQDYRECVICKEIKPISKFDINRRQCKLCRGRKHKKYFHEAAIQKKYNLTIEDYYELLKQQQGNCAICNTNLLKQTRKPHIDHDHKTNTVRGLLCANCNMGIGHLRDDYRICLNAVMYLKRHNDKQ